MKYSTCTDFVNIGGLMLVMWNTKMVKKYKILVL